MSSTQPSFLAVRDEMSAIPLRTLSGAKPTSGGWAETTRMTLFDTLGQSFAEICAGPARPRRHMSGMRHPLTAPPRIDTQCLRSERFEFAVHNLYFAPVELSHNEAIEALIVGTAIVTQEPEGLLLADEKAADTVGTIMNAGCIAPERNVAGEFVDFVAEFEI